MRPILNFLARLYGFGVAFRLTLYRTGYRKRRRLRSFTISIGNLTVGGTGKTPMVEYVARLLLGEGHSVSILTRGYGRSHADRQVVLGRAMKLTASADEAGDEPLMLARHLPGATVVINRNRYEGGLWAESQAGADVHILDDGFQHLALDRDLNLLLVDAERPFDSGQLLPLGSLREPLAEIRRASAVLLTRTDRPFDQAELERQIRYYAADPDIPIFYAYHDLTAIRSVKDGTVRRPQEFEGRRVAAICAIARPDLFLEDLRHFGLQVVHHLARRDHSQFPANLLEPFFATATQAGAEAVLTTEKDWVRLERQDLPAHPPLWVASIEVRMVDEAGFRSFVSRSITMFRPPPPSSSP